MKANVDYRTLDYNTYKSRKISIYDIIALLQDTFCVVRIGVKLYERPLVDVMRQSMILYSIIKTSVISLMAFISFIIATKINLQDYNIIVWIVYIIIVAYFGYRIDTSFEERRKKWFYKKFKINERKAKIADYITKLDEKQNLLETINTVKIKTIKQNYEYSSKKVARKNYEGYIVWQWKKYTSSYKYEDLEKYITEKFKEEDLFLENIVDIRNMDLGQEYYVGLGIFLFIYLPLYYILPNFLSIILLYILCICAIFYIIISLQKINVIYKSSWYHLFGDFSKKSLILLIESKDDRYNDDDYLF